MKAEGLETVMAVQYMTRFVLTERLIIQLEVSQNARIVTIAGGDRYILKHGTY